MADLRPFFAGIAATSASFNVMNSRGAIFRERVRQRLLRNSQIVGYIHRSGSTMNGFQHGNDQ